MQHEQHTVIVTGGSGYVGRALCQKLVSLDYNVVNIDRNKREIPGVTQYPFDLNNNQLKGIMVLLKPYAVIHLASENPKTNTAATTSSVFQINVADTISLINHTVAAGIKHIIVSGYTDCVTGLDDDYLKSKNIIDQLLPHYANTYDIKYATLKYPSVAGVSPDHKDATETGISQIIRGIIKNDNVEYLGTPKKYMHVLDVVDAHVQALHHIVESESAVIQLVPEQEYTDAQIADIVKRQLAGVVSECPSNVTCEQMHFQPKYNIEHIINHTLSWIKKRR
jgi:UDP-glucose 4-epimerase